MNRITRRSLLGGLTVVGAGTLLAPTAHAGVLPGATGRLGVPLAAPAQPLQDPPNVDIIVNNGGTAAGLLFLTAQGFASPNSPRGPQIVDNEGRTIWFRSIPLGTFSTDFRVQRYQGRPVLTWWEGTATMQGIGFGVGYIANTSYEVIATVGENLDLHDLLLTDEGTALVTVYEEAPADLTPVGGPSNGTVWNCVVQELDIATGEPVWQWSSIEHVPVTESALAYRGTGSFDYLHVNGLGLDVDGNLVICGRHADAVYKVDRATGEVLFRIGGSSSSFELGEGAAFVGQHDSQGEGGNVYRIFDNQTHGTMQGERIGTAQSDRSRVIWLEIDEEAGTASLVNELTHPEPLLAIAEGGAQRLPNGNVLVSWGQASRVSEFSESGELLLDAVLDPGFSSYRAYRFPWRARPACDPEVAIDEVGELHAVWNGATDVASWRVLGARGDAGFRGVAEVPWQGLDTTLPLAESVRQDNRHFRVVALDRRGRALGSSRVTAIGGSERAAR